ncbi:MAG: hypothetical protein Q4C46_06520 [Bacillota bacterium]|nr:hypothetical protein [Bacillota bacterium]
MRKIKLVPDKPFHNRCEIAIIDMTDGEKRRGKITAEYARADINQLQKQGLDYDGAMNYFREMIDDVIRYYILGDWECVGGYDETMEIIASHVKLYY